MQLVSLIDYMIQSISLSISHRVVISLSFIQMNRKIEYAFHKFNLAEIHPCPIVYICPFQPFFRVDQLMMPRGQVAPFLKCFKIVCQTFIPEWAHYRPYKPTRTTLESISICRVFSSYESICLELRVIKIPAARGRIWSI